jgi:hypothetical protein
LAAVESWLLVFSVIPVTDWFGINVDLFTQFTHCLVVLFKLGTLDEPGWDLEAVKHRADLFGILDRSCEIVDSIPAAVGMVDADGPRKGLLFKTADLFRAIKALFLAEMPPNLVGGTYDSQSGGSNGNGATDFAGEASVTDDFILSLADEPWLSDIMWTTYALGSELDVASAGFEFGNAGSV